MDWSAVDYLWIIVMFLSDSHSDGTHSLQSIHCWDTDAETHFYKPDEETNSSWTWMVWGWAHFHFWVNYSLNDMQELCLHATWSTSQVGYLSQKTQSQNAGRVHSKKEKTVIISLPSCSKPVWISFSLWTQKKIF